jgi:hypothetical protein
VSDEIDRANERAQELLDESLAKRRESGPPPCGACYFCHEPLAPGLRWCDTDCRKDWERLEAVNKSKAGRYYDESEKE